MSEGPVTTTLAARLEAARGGDDDSMAAIWAELNPRLLRYLRVRHGEGADDVASETWMRVTRHISTFVGSDVEFRAWIFTIARSASADWHRRAARRPQSVGDLAQVAERPSLDDPATSAIDALDTRAALELVARLPAGQAEVVLLRVIAGLDAERVGKIVGKSTGAVRVLQHRGLRRLAEVLADPSERTTSGR
jgi:RNA polymerase sigma-70 factor (ECF subfamily)